MQKRYKILNEDGQLFAARQDVAVEVDAEAEIELSMQQEKAMVAAGWIEGPIEPKGKKEG